MAMIYLIYVVLINKKKYIIYIMDSNRYITIGPIYGLKNIYYNLSLINKSKPEFVSKNLVLNNLRNNIYHKIIDSRDSLSFKNNHYPNAVNSKHNFMKNLNKSNKYLIYGNSDMSYFVGCKMINNGFKNIEYTDYNLATNDN